MHVAISGTFPAEIRQEMEMIVRAGFVGVECDDVEVHVKARARVERRYIAEVTDRGQLVRWAYRRKRDALAHARADGGSVVAETRRSPRAGDWTGRAYDGVPSISKVSPGTAYLVTMNIPADPRRLTRYPFVHQDPRLKTGPEILLACWQDELFHVAAHEARHIVQFRHSLKRSELDAERWAAGALERRRAEQRPLTLFDPGPVVAMPAAPVDDDPVATGLAQRRVRELISSLGGGRSR